MSIDLLQHLSLLNIIDNIDDPLILNKLIKQIEERQIRLKIKDLMEKHKVHYIKNVYFTNTQNSNDEKCGEYTIDFGKSGITVKIVDGFGFKMEYITKNGITPFKRKPSYSGSDVDIDKTSFMKFFSIECPLQDEIKFINFLEDFVNTFNTECKHYIFLV